MGRVLAGVLALTLCGYGSLAEAAGAPPPPPPPPAATTIVNYDFNAGSGYSGLTPTLASGTTSSASSTQPFLVRAGTATGGGAFTANASAGRGVALGDSTGTNTRYFQFQLGGASLPLNRHYKVHVQAQRPANGAPTVTLAYSTDGATFTNLPATLNLGIGVYLSRVFDLSSIAALDHQSTIYFRLMASGAAGGPGAELVIDNFQVQAEVVTCPTAFTVDGTGDTPDADPADGVCADGSGACTLRAALAESNALTFCSAQTVNVTAKGSIALASGLPTITRGVTILGPGATLLSIRGNNTFRLLNIRLTTSGAVTINDLGFANGGKAAGENATALEFNDNGTLTLNRDEFYGNSGPGASSVIFSNASAALNMTDSTVRDNAVEHVIMIGNTPFAFDRVTIASNAGTGAAIFLFGAVPNATITSATITNNTQGLWHANTGLTSTVTIRNSIFSQNSINVRRTGSATCAVNGIVSGGYNLFDDNPGTSLCSAAPTDLIGASFNPQLSPLDYYGGTTKTRMPAAASPAIDKGKSFTATTDQRGNRRPIDTVGVASADGGDAADIGAVERGGFVVNSLADTGDATPDGLCDSGGGTCTLREAIQEANNLADADTIGFAAGLAGTITLGSGLPTITRPVTILGPGANVLAVGGNSTFRLVNILLAAPGIVTLNDLAFRNGGKAAGENAAALEFNNVGTLILNRDEFSGHSGPSGSSVIFSNAAAGLIMTGSTVRDNAVEHVVMIGTTPFAFDNVTIASNTGTGAAIFLFGAVPTATITSATITNNTQGLWHANTALSSSVTIRNSIFSQNGNVNLRRTGPGTCATNGIVSGGYNLIDNDAGSVLCATTATDLIGASFDPQLVPLASFGGTTRTRPPLGGSPVLDRGHRFGLSVDQRGQARPFDNPAVAPAAGGDNSDIGAFELQAACGAVTLGPTSLPGWNTSLPYNRQVTASGAITPYTFTIVSGSLPPGVTMAPNGALSGTPTSTGTFTFTVLAASANGCYGMRQYTISIGVCTTISLSPPTVPSGVMGTAYSQALTASGGVGPYSYVSAGTLPPGLTVSSGGLFTGTPTALGAFPFTVTATAANGCTGGQSYTAAIFARPTGLSLSNASVAENSPAATAVGTFSTVDADSASFTYTLVGGAGDADNASFAIGGSQLQTTAVFDRETKASYSIRVRTTDPNSLTFEQAFTIVIADVNEPPTGMTLSAAIVSENSGAGTAVGSLSTTDPDTGAVHTYTLVAGSGADDNAVFAIAGTALRIETVANFETKASYTVRVRSTDQAGLFFEKAFVIGIADVNEPPTGLALSPASVAENSAAGTTVGSLSTTDPDAAGVHTYTLVAGGGADDNALFAIAGNALSINTVADFETKSSYTVRVRSTDQAGLFFEKAFAIGIADVNEVPTNIALSAASVAENNAAGATVGSLSTTDPDAAAVHTYTLAAGGGADDNALFAIAGNALRIETVANFETKSSYSVRVRSTDQSSLFFEKVFVITITNLDEPPTDITLSPSNVAENNAAGTTVGSLTTADPDAGAVHLYTLVAGGGADDNALFAIAGNALRINTAANFETKPSYTVRVRSTDQAGLFFDKAFVIGVTNVNEPPTISDLADQNIGANATTGPLGFSIGDPETAAAALTVTATSNNAALVPNDPAHLTLAGAGASRTVTVTPAANATGTATIAVTVSDGTLTATDQFVVNVACPSAIGLSALPVGLVDAPYAQTIAASGGSGSYAFALAHGTLPAGLTLSSSGLLSGTPAQTGSFTFGVTATDTQSGCSGSRDYAVTIGHAVTAGQVVISEFRLRGRDPDGIGPLLAQANEFVEFANTTAADVVVSSGDASAGWALVASDGLVRFIIPNGATIPAHGHYLAVNGDGYGLSTYPSGHDGSIATTATGDAILLPDGTPSGSYSLEIPDGAGLALFRTAAPSALGDTAARLDAVGFEGGGNPLYYEGTPLAPAGGVTIDVEHTFARQFATGRPQDTNQNRSDFLLVAPVAGTLPGAGLGSPGPENTTSPVNRSGTSGLTEGLIDTGSGVTSTMRPNRERNACGSVPSAPCGGPTRFGDMIIRRKFTNSSASPITRLRFRVVDLSTYPAPDGAADLRALSSPAVVVDSSSDGLVTVLGTVLEGPPEQLTQGGGWNATLSCCQAGGGVTLAQPLAPGATIYLQWRLGVQQTGAFKFYLVIEALP